MIPYDLVLFRQKYSQDQGSNLLHFNQHSSNFPDQRPRVDQVAHEALDPGRVISVIS